MCGILGTYPPCETSLAYLAHRGPDTAGILKMPQTKPRILLLVDKPGWAFDTAAQAITKYLSDEFDFRIEYVRNEPDLNTQPFDLIYVFFWGETYHQKFVTDSRRIIKEISSHRWALEEQYGCLSAEQAAQRYLADAATLTATSHRLEKIFWPFREVHCVPNGFDPSVYFNRNGRSGPLKIGWAGNADDPCKGLNDILRPAAAGEFELRVASGSLNPQEMAGFYNSIDVLCVASTAEGEPLTLLEGVACGCFPVAVDVGIVPELVSHRKNGLIVKRDLAAFRAAFQWCATNIERVREVGRRNAEEMLRGRTWDQVSGAWRRALRSACQKLNGRKGAATVFAGDEAREIWNRNLGDKLLEWPDRARESARLIQSLPLPPQATLIDLGCGHQTLRKLIPTSVRYIPVDRVARAPEIVVMDLSQTLPTGRYTVATMLGLLEYMDDARRILRWAAEHTDYCLFSYNDCTDSAQRTREHWKSTLTFEQIEMQLRPVGGQILRKLDLGKSEFLYLVQFDWKPQVKTLALFSAAVNGDNSGDALIVDATQRLLAAHSHKVFPLLQPLTEQQLEEINACDIAVICGTNLYQQRFACALTPEIIARIKVPIFPLGIGTSAPIGQLPNMDDEGMKAVRMIHERCAVGSVRDPLSLEFVRRLGIKNVELTGCPVLFHAKREPQFHPATTQKIYLSIRARLLHVDQSFNSRETRTLETLCQTFRPKLVLQSPYDLPIVLKLVEQFGVEYVHDETYGCEPMLRAAQDASRTVGFRLHFGMVSLSYGKPATFIGTDTRTSEFCDMMGLPYHDIRTYQDDALVRELRTPLPDMARFLENWRALRSAMASMLERNGVSPAL